MGLFFGNSLPFPPSPSPGLPSFSTGLSDVILLKGASGKYMNASQKSHLGMMFAMIFRVQWGQKLPESGKMCFDKNVPGPCKGATGRSSISGGDVIQQMSTSLLTGSHKKLKFLNCDPPIHPKREFLNSQVTAI